MTPQLSGPVFDRAREEGRAALVGYLPAGFPSYDGCIAALTAMVDAGVDVVELGLPYSDPVIDGPTIQAAAEIATEARTLTTGEGLVSNHQFYLAARPFVTTHPEIIAAVVKSIAALDAWANGNTDAVAAKLSTSVGIPSDILKIALARQTYGVKPISEAVIAEQQRIADAFQNLGLLRGRIAVSEAVWKVGS